MKKIEAKIVADSINQQGDRITTMLLTYPRFIHGELLTHRVFSKNSASSRAIPFKKMVEMVKTDPFIPIAWQKDHKGMQGSEYMLEDDVFSNIKEWLQARDYAIKQATYLHERGVTKQLCNRLLEPFMWHTVLLTGTEFKNFFELRCPKYHTPVSGDRFYFKSKKDCIANHSNPINLKKLEDMSNIEWMQINFSQAEIHMQALAEAMWDAMNESTPKELEAGEYHIPFGDKINLTNQQKWDNSSRELIEADIKVATARCARLSYMTFDGEIDYEKDLKLHDTLLESQHFSPFEHCARVMSEEEYYSSIKGSFQQESEIDVDGYIDISTHANNSNSFGWCRNFKGFLSYRHLIENELWK